MPDAGTCTTANYIDHIMTNQATSTTTTTKIDPPPVKPPKSVGACIGRLFVGIVRTIPTAIFGGAAAVFIGFHTQTFDSSESGVIISDRFIEGAYFNVMAKVLFRFIIPIITGWNPGHIFGPGLQGACLGYYFGSYGRRRCPLECCLIVSSISMLIAAVVDILTE
jgi:hypothetical protein